MGTAARRIAVCAMGIALYVCLSMTVKLPLIGHIGLDLGYAVLAVYCYWYDPFSSAVVGAVGCTLVSLLTSGWFPPGWFVGNAVIAVLCSLAYQRDQGRRALAVNLLLSVEAVFLGVFVIKSVMECWMFQIPLPVKLPKSAVAFVTDSIVMCAGVLAAPRIRGKGRREDHSDG